MTICVCVCVCGGPNARVMLSGMKDLGSQFTSWWVFLHSYYLLPQTLPWQPNPLCLCGSKLSSHLPLGFSSPSKSLSLSLSLCVFFPKPKKPPCQSFSLLFYSLPLVGVQIITFSSVPMQSHLCLESQGKMIPFEHSHETCFKHQIMFSNELPKGTNSARGPT